MDSVRNALNAVLNPPRNRLNAFRHDWTHNYTSWQKWRLIVSIIGILSLPVVLFECELASPYPLASQQTFTLDFTGSHHVVATMDNTSFSPLGSALFGKLEVGYGSYEPASGVEFSEEQKQAKAKTFYPQSVAGAQTGDSYHWDLDVEGSGDLDVVRRDSTAHRERATHSLTLPIYPPWVNPYRLWYTPHVVFLTSTLLIPKSRNGNTLSVRRLMKEGWILVMKEDDGTLDSGPRTNQFNEGDSLGPDMSGGFAWDGNYVFQGRAGWKPEGTQRVWNRYGEWLDRKVWSVGRGFADAWTPADMGRGLWTKYWGRSGMGVGMVLKHRARPWEVRPVWTKGKDSGRPEWQVTVMVADLKPQGNWLTQTWSRLSR